MSKTCGDNVSWTFGEYMFLTCGEELKPSLYIYLLSSVISNTMRQLFNSTKMLKVVRRLQFMLMEDQLPTRLQENFLMQKYRTLSDIEGRLAIFDSTYRYVDEP